MRSLALITATLLLTFTSVSEGALLCSQAYSALKTVKASHLGFSQNFIGRYWANIKTQEIVKDFDNWEQKKT